MIHIFAMNLNNSNNNQNQQQPQQVQQQQQQVQQQQVQQQQPPNGQQNNPNVIVHAHNMNPQANPQHPPQINIVAAHAANNPNQLQYHNYAMAVPMVQALAQVVVAPAIAAAEDAAAKLAAAAAMPVKIEDIKTEYRTTAEYNTTREIGYINRVEFTMKIDRFSARSYYAVRTQFHNLTLIVDPKDVVKHLRHYVVIDLQSGMNHGENEYCFQISVVRGEHDLYHTKEMRKSFVNGFPVSGSMYHLRRSILMDPKNGFLVNDTITFFVMIEEVPPSNLPDAFQRHICTQMSNDYASLLSNGTLTDSVLVFPGGAELNVHKIVLAARSPVFRAMFADDTMEAKSNRVEIPDVPHDVFEQLLMYMYSGTIEQLDQFALELMTAADKYQMTLLKDICEKRILSKLTPESVVSILGYADLHSSRQLRQRCISFITKHSTVVMRTAAWKDMIKTSPNLLAELYEDMASKTQQFFGDQDKNK